MCESAILVLEEVDDPTPAPLPAAGFCFLPPVNEPDDLSRRPHRSGAGRSVPSALRKPGGCLELSSLPLAALRAEESAFSILIAPCSPPWLFDRDQPEEMQSEP